MEKWRSGGGGNDEAEVKVKVEAEMNVEAEARAEVKAGGMKMGGTKVVEGGWQVEDPMEEKNKKKRRMRECGEKCVILWNIVCLGKMPEMERQKG